MLRPAHPEEQEATRARLMDAAGEVFAEQGFQSATVRDICARAGANVAAVNYHFHDKMELYLAVLRRSVSAAQADDIPASALRTEDPAKLLRLFIAGMLRRMCRAEQPGACHLRIMAHEIAHPTEALPRVVEEIIAPRYAALRGLLARIVGLPPDHDTTRLCAHSVIAQVVHYAQARPVIACLWPALEMTPARIDEIAAHIADFSLDAIRAIAKKNRKVSQ